MLSFIDFIPSFISKYEIFEQFSKTKYPYSINPSGNADIDKLPQPAKEQSQNFIIDDGILISERLEQPEKARFSIISIESGKITLTKLLQSRKE